MDMPALSVVPHPAAADALGSPGVGRTGGLETLRKLGTEDIGMTETTPIVFKGELYRFESVRSGNWNNTLNCTNNAPGEGRRCAQHLRFRRQSGPPGWTTGEVVTSFGVGYDFGCAFVDKDETVFAYASGTGVAAPGVRGTSATVTSWSSPTISPASTWVQRTALELGPGYTVFNTAVAVGMLGDKETYVMAIEVRHAQLGGGFQLVFATAPSASGPWKLGQSLPSKGLMFGPGSCPALRYDSGSGFWHLLYTPNPTVPDGDYRTWQVWAARSRTLAFGSWTMSPMNPVMVADAFDRQIHNEEIRHDEQGWASNTTDLNDSDPDLVEFEGHVLFVGNWGDQRTTPTNSLYQAVYKGSMTQFWASLYPPSGWPV